MSYYTHAKNAVYLRVLKQTKGNIMISYDQASQRYENSKAPTRSKKWLNMPDSPRYLRNVQADHMGIHKTTEGAIYYRLYNTQVAKLYPPEANGDYKVETNYYASQTTNIFMYENGLNFSELETTEGKRVRVPYVPSWDRAEGIHKPSAILWFDKDHKLIVSKSSHRDIYTMRSSDEDKAKRKEFKKKVDVLMTLAMFRLPEYRANVTIESSLGEPFGTAWRNSPHQVDDFAKVIRDVGSENTEDPRYIEAFLDMGQAVFDILASHRVYNYIPEGERWQGGLFRTWNRTAEQIMEMRTKQQEIASEVSAEEFKKSLTNRVLSMVNLKTGTVKTPWGQFMDTIPRKSFY